MAGLVLTLRDVTEQRQLEEQLKYQAFHDALTGLPNRLLFQDRISQQVAAARLDGATVGVLFVDLDDFKVVNDTMGHGVGDELLVATAVRLFGLIRECDTAARLGGDEFALLITNAPDSAAVEAAAERVVSGVRRAARARLRGRARHGHRRGRHDRGQHRHRRTAPARRPGPVRRPRRRASGSGAVTSPC